jgi:uncharacterized protein YndB with AHSA1/START domain
MNAPTDSLAATSDREITLSRVFDAPRERVFQMWTDPKHVGHWWGPRGFTITLQKMDVRPGGEWQFVMHGPDGRDYQNKCVYVEVAPPERLVYDHVSGPVFRTTATFDDEGGKTRLTVRMVFESAALRDKVAREYGAVEGLQQTIDRLGDELAAGREVVTSRLFDAPPERVFEAFRDPDRLARWWGPDGFTNTIHEFDPRPGGAWRLTMHGPDGTDYLNESVFVEVAPERIVFDHLEPVHKFRMTITLGEHGGKTNATWRMHFDSAEECARVRAFVADANEQNFNRLAEELATMAHDDVQFVVSREFAAPRELVFKLWTETEHLARWFGPVGFTTIASKNDPRPGGVFHYCMRAPNGHEMWGKWVYREIVPPERLAFVSSFSDAQGNTVRAPFSETWPLEVLSTVTFAERDGKTTITMRGVPINATEAERQTFKEMHGSMRQGWGGTLNQLAEYLSGGNHG